MLEMDLAASLRAVETAMRAGNRIEAMAFAGQAARLGADRPQILVLAAYDALERGAAGEALGYAERARSANRRDGETLNAYALSLSANGRHSEALSAFDEALRHAAGQGSHRFFYGKGCIYEETGNNASARLCFERAVAANPNDVRSLSRLALLAVERGDFSAARDYGERTSRLMPGEPCATLAMASADVHEKNYAAALTRLAPFAAQPPNINRAIAENLTGEALDGLGRRREAFAAYTASNATMQALYAPVFDVPDNARAAVDRLIAYFRDAPAADWQCRKTGDAARCHVFLVGFPRSGTTLLEQALAAHPAIDCMEEVACLPEQEFLDDPAALLAASPEEIDALRQRYWAAVRDSGQTLKCPVFIDKLPLNAVVLFLVAKLFPDAKILFALRDPADVVWSAFRRRFAMSAQMYELTGLERAARYYDGVMTLAMLYQGKLGLDWHEVRYETLVADFEGETQRICRFLGVEWSAAMADFAATSRRRAPNTPSSAQVARGLYSTAVGQWTLYRDELQSVLPILAPWRARFGYQEQNDAPRSS